MVTKQMSYVDTVRDGDSFHTREKGEVRLVDVCAPEKNQMGFSLAKQRLESLILHKNVRLIPKGRDTFGRLLAEVYVGPIHVNLAQRSNGYRC